MATTSILRQMNRAMKIDTAVVETGVIAAVGLLATAIVEGVTIAIVATVVAVAVNLGRATKGWFNILALAQEAQASRRNVILHQDTVILVVVLALAQVQAVILQNMIILVVVHQHIEVGSLIHLLATTHQTPMILALQQVQVEMQIYLHFLRTAKQSASQRMRAKNRYLLL